MLYIINVVYNYFIWYCVIGNNKFKSLFFRKFLSKENEKRELPLILMDKKEINSDKKKNQILNNNQDLSGENALINNNQDDLKNFLIGLDK